MELLSIPAIAAIVQAAKIAGLPSKFAPIASIILGVGLALILLDADVVARVGTGLVLGLSASGLYSYTKPTLQKLGVQ
jgi:hypothetical protein